MDKEEMNAAVAPGDSLRAAIVAAYRMDEAACVEALLPLARLTPAIEARVRSRAATLVEGVRQTRHGVAGLDSFLREFDLSSAEGVVLMCLAEALLRIPDVATADRLIRDKLGAADWERHLGHSDSILVNASTWALMLTGRLIATEDEAGGDWRTVLRRLVARSGEPVIRTAVRQAMRILGHQFVLGRTIGEALDRAAADSRYRYSFDMLGEAACTDGDAERYVAAYAEAIAAIGRAAGGRGPVEGPGISVKLSALHPRFEEAQAARIMVKLVPRLAALAARACEAGISLTVDAEEADRLDLTLDIFAAIAADPGLAGWDGLGLAVQAYQKRALPVLDWLADLARRHRRRLPVRLVKGAYWDTEIKRAQVGGFAGYPVFSRKATTDVSYLACVRRILETADAFIPAFATHNAHTAAAVIELAAEAGAVFEFQRLHGMGEELFNQILAAPNPPPCRVYAPVGGHEDLLAYLVRRLLENGANTSFVNRIADAGAPIASLVADPVARVAALSVKPHPRIPLPDNLYGAERRNARGIDLTDRSARAALLAAMEKAAVVPWRAVPIVGGREVVEGAERSIVNPARQSKTVGTVVEADAATVARALGIAARAQESWDAVPAAERAAILARAADLMEAETAAFMALAVREGGKTLPDAVAEVREAVDYLRYYGLRAIRDFGAAEPMPGPTGEVNRVLLHGRGVFGCISPWNFPLAIFTGQVAAALAAGNAVLAKPASQTPLIAAAAVRLLHRAGVPVDVLHFLPGGGATVGSAMASSPAIAGIAFTGSTETARWISRALAAREAPIVPLIAETGGQNAMIVDSSALPEQVTRDVLSSAFQSAGQRCSALRVLFIQDDVAARILTMIAGAMRELSVGDPWRLSTDVGPIIDGPSRDGLLAHAARMTREGRPLAEVPLDPDLVEKGWFFAPRAFEIDSISRLNSEVFGPILHVVRFAAGSLDAVVDAVNGTGFGLTLGIHSRIESTIRRILARVRVGNTYVNRNQIGAVVGVQPFGGEGLSGTGPKAGGPRYLHRFATERTVSVDTTAAGGNASLLTLTGEDD